MNVNLWKIHNDEKGGDSEGRKHERETCDRGRWDKRSTVRIRGNNPKPSTSPPLSSIFLPVRLQLIKTNDTFIPAWTPPKPASRLRLLYFSAVCRWFILYSFMKGVCANDSDAVINYFYVPYYSRDSRPKYFLFRSGATNLSAGKVCSILPPILHGWFEIVDR